jgi:hypothetical protein
MKILSIPHTTKQRRELFAWIGETCASAAVRKALGAPITSTIGKDIWFLAVDGETLLGLCAVQIPKDGKPAKLHGFYVYDSRRGAVPERLLAAAENYAGGEKAGEITAVDAIEQIPVYEAAGWTVGEQRGQKYRNLGKALVAQGTPA